MSGSLHSELMEVFQHSTCSWSDALMEVSYTLAVLLVYEEDAAERMSWAETTTTLIMKAARDGALPGEVMQ